MQGFCKVAETKADFNDLSQPFLLFQIYHLSAYLPSRTVNKAPHEPIERRSWSTYSPFVTPFGLDTHRIAEWHSGEAAGGIAMQLCTTHLPQGATGPPVGVFNRYNKEKGTFCFLA